MTNNIDGTKETIQLDLLAANNSPYAYHGGEPVSLAQFKFDVMRSAEQISKTQGETLITSPGRYAFSVGLLSSWLTGRAVVLPPDNHQMSWQKIRDQHTIGFECDQAFSTNLRQTRKTTPRKNAGVWSVKLPAMQTAVKLYTSGTTGLPCVVNKSLHNLFKEAIFLSQYFDWPKGAIIGTVPAQHLYGLTFTILLAWVLGVPVVDELPFYPEDISKLIAQTNAGTLISVPAHYNVLIRNGFKPGSVFCLSATAPLSEQTALQWRKLNQTQILEIYGSTETGVIGFRRQPDQQQWTRFAPVQLSAQAGLLNVSSAFIHPQFDAQFQTADEVNLTSDDTFNLLGRLGAVIKIAGKRISLLEIEQSLLACSNIADAAVLAVDVKGLARDKAIWAAVVCQTQCIDSVAAIRLELSSKLEGTKIPKRFVFVDQLPRNSSGKVSRQALLDLFEVADNDNV